MTSLFCKKNNLFYKVVSNILIFLHLFCFGPIRDALAFSAASAYAINADNGVPRGMIALWSGSVANIPSGWALCDGTNSTPDLRDKFVKSIPSSATNPGATSGAAIHSHDAGGYAAPNHSHTVPLSGHSTYPYGPAGVIGGSISGHEHQVTSAITTSSGGIGVVTGTSANESSLPPYYELAFIMKL